MKRMKLHSLMVACAVAFAGSAWAADDITKCGSAQLKAFGSLFNSIYKEAARACGTATSDVAPAPANEVNEDKVESFTNKFNKAITSTETKFGDANCFLDDSGGETLPVADVLTTTQDAADDLCTSDGSA